MANQAILKGKNVPISREYKTLSDVICINAQKFPNNGMNFIANSGQEEFFSYPQLIEKALYTLNGLKQKGVQVGDILLIQIDDPKKFFIVFWACIFGKIVPAPISQPGSFSPGSVQLDKLFNILKLLPKPLLVIDEKYKEQYEILKDSELYPDFQFITTFDLQAKQMSEIHPAQPHDLAVLQFSSGSTGNPKGVKLTHTNIITNIYSISKILNITEKDNTFSWLPHTHDMGLFCLYLTSVISGCSIHIFTPATFIRSPFLFLNKISEHKGTWFAAPNFAYEYMCKRISDEKISTLDLSSIRYVLNGAEPISLPVTKRFIEKFSAGGFKESMMCPCYGMAEATVAVCAAINTGIDDQLKFIPVGPPIYNTSIRIADQNANTLVENHVGEIEIKGDAVTFGYYQDAIPLPELFNHGWLRTGDLGFINNGSLVIVGRSKDVIFVRGQNYFANDLEEILYSLELFPRGNIACTGLFNQKSQTEQILVFVQQKKNAQDFLVTREKIISKLLETLSLEITHVIPIKKMPKTTSGKVQRYFLRDCYINGDFNDVLAKIDSDLHKEKESLNKSEFKTQKLEDKLLRIWSEVLAMPANKISLDSTFFSLGGNSIKAYQMLNELEKSLDREIDPEILVKCKTINETIEYLTKSQEHCKSSASDNLAEDVTIAITGMALRFPGSRNQKDFWNNLKDKRNCINQVSSKRKELAKDIQWDDWLGEVEDIDFFDNDFFDITQEEAIVMDPQQRLALEVSYEALEDAGVLANISDEQNIGVFSAVSANSYLQLVIKHLEKYGINSLHQNSLIGNMTNMISAQVARYYNFTGAALSIDTACSSFLVAFHYAVTALQRNEISGAVVIGANLLVTPTIHLLAKKAGILSTSQYSKVFDKNADGTVLGEGVIVFYLEPLHKALSSNKHIYAIVRGSAINNDGSSFALMAPNPKGQLKVLQDAYAKANVRPDEVNYIEVHGSGTTIGDPIELYTLSKLFKENSTIKTNDVAIGSIKSNIGHLLPAAGGAGLAKVLLCMNHKKFVPSLHLEQVNPSLKLDKSPFYIVQDICDWHPKKDQTRKAGLSSFGFGGTNAHIVLEEWDNDFQTVNHNSYYLITCSAKTTEALEIVLEQTQSMLNHDEININNLCFTRNRYRKHYPLKAALLISDKAKNLKVLEIQKGEQKKSFPKIAILIGDITSNNQTYEDSFNYWREIIQKLIINTENIHHISGVDSGAKLVESLDKKYMPKKETLSENNCYNDLNCDIILSLNYANIHSHQAKVIQMENGCFPSPYFHLLTLMAQLYVSGASLRWEMIHPDGTGKLINLPAYPFKQKSLWVN